MIRTIVGILLLSASLNASAEPEVFWVLGSFSQARNADTEKDRLASELEIAIEVRFDKDRGLFRVVAPAATVSREALRGNSAWRRLTVESAAVDEAATVNETMVNNAGALKTPVAAPDEISTDQAVPEASKAEETSEAEAASEAQPLYPPFKERESLSEYCDRLPKTSLCQHPKTRRILSKDRMLSGYRRNEQPDCSQILDQDRRRTCEAM